MQEVIKAPSRNGMRVRIRQLPMGSSDTRQLLKEMKKEQEFYVIFDCSYQMASELLKQVPNETHFFDS